MTLTFEFDLDTVKMNQCAKYLGHRSSRSEVVVRTHWTDWSQGYHTSGFPCGRTHPLFRLLSTPGVQAGFRKSAVCPGFWPNPQLYFNVAVCKGVRRHETKKAR